MSLEDDLFDYQVTKSGILLIRRGGRTVMELGGKKAAALIPRLGRDDDTDQQLLARATGNFRHGNERQSGRHRIWLDVRSVVGTVCDMSQSTASEFSQATAVTRQGDHSFTAELDAGWKVAGAVNGGYLLGVAGQALRAVHPSTPDPLVISTFYLGPSREGPVDITTRTLREGRSTASYGIELSQNGAPTISAMATMGNLGELPDDVGTTATPPQLPPPEECVGVAEASEDFKKAAPLIQRFDMRLDPATTGFAVGKPSGRGVLQGWIRFIDGSDPDPLSLLTFLDSFPPVMFDLGRFNWAPTMELTAHVRALPAPGWISARLSTRNIAGGMFEEDCELWDSAGRLVAQSRQLARQPRG